MTTIESWKGQASFAYGGIEDAVCQESVKNFTDYNERQVIFMKTIDFKKLYWEAIDTGSVKTLKERAGWWIVRRIVEFIDIADDCADPLAPIVLMIAAKTYGEPVSVDFNRRTMCPITEDEPDEQ